MLGRNGMPVTTVTTDLEPLFNASSGKWKRNDRNQSKVTHTGRGEILTGGGYFTNGVVNVPLSRETIQTVVEGVGNILSNCRQPEYYKINKTT